MGYQRNFNNNQNGYNYQRNNYGGNNNYSPQPQQVQPQSPEEFINERLDVYQMFEEAIRARGLDPTNFAFGLTQWVTSYCMAKKGK